MQADIVFECSDSFGYEVTQTTALSISGITASTRSDAVTFGGSAPWQAPVITVTYSSVTDGTAKELLIGNSAIGQQVAITADWASSDVLVIDSYNKTVKINGTDVAFSGAIPEWPPGSGNWSYSDNLMARNFAATITYYKRFI